ncbi:MAG: HAMP domain-containing methyl-accepting chemotaxis protein [Desulfatitalea sp.]
MISLKNAPLWMKTAMGSVAILVLFGLSVMFGIFKLNGIVEKVSLFNDASQLAESLYMAQGHQDTYLREQNDIQAEAFRTTLGQIAKLSGRLKPQVGGTPLLDHLQKMESSIVLYNQAFDKVVANTTEIKKLKQVMTSAYDGITNLLSGKVKVPLDAKKSSALTSGGDISPYDQELLSLTEKLLTLMMTTRLNEITFFARGETREAQRVYAAMESVGRTFEEWSFVVGTLDDPQVKTYPAIIQQALKEYNRPTFEQVVRLWIDNQQITVAMLKQRDENLAAINTFKQETAKLVEIEKTGALRSLSMLLGLGLILGIGISILTGYRTSQPIQKIVAMFRDIAEGEGDLTRRLAVDRGDELGEQAKWFNLFVAKIQQMVQQVVQITEALNHSSVHLSGLAGRLSGGAGQMKSRSNKASAVTEEMSASIRSVAGTMEQASNNVGLIVQSAEEMNATIREIAVNAEKGRQIASQTVAQTLKASEEIHLLGKAAEEIGKVTESITEISEQTNLLALNATIEAARAGESGRGFAVVANEIKQLAQQTAQATHEIKSRIENIQQATNGSVERISEISKVIHDVSDIISTISTAIEAQAAGTRKIANNVGQASEGLNYINDHITQSAITSESLAQDISQVDQEAGQLSNGGLEVDRSAHELLQLAQQLKTLMGRFVVA